MAYRILKIPNNTLKNFFRVANAIYRLPLLVLGGSERDILVNVLAHSQPGVPPDLKLKIYDALKRLRRRRKRPFGMIVVLGWRREWDEKYASLPDATQNVFQNRKADISNFSQDRVAEMLSEIADFDGAVLLNRRGEAVASGMYLENMSPKKVAETLFQGRSQDLSSAFGFRKKVHTRHLAAIAASYLLEGTTVFVVSEEDGSIRIMEHGRIIWSTMKREPSR